ncbi:MAG: hypothetical protein HQL15_09240, partial [Candidatus Omnitrophica bacterium]|nr:hypothetical protein [Candidatus Omnitrophota bacterium]
SQIVREIVIPELTREVNEGKNFAQLRQVYNSLILATWYKKKIKDSILSQVYADRNKIAGVQPISSLRESETTEAISTGTTHFDKIATSPTAPRNDVDIIYQRYLQAFKKGVYNYIKEEPDPATRQTVPRKYFSGGENFTHMPMDSAMTFVQKFDVKDSDHAMRIEVNAEPIIDMAQTVSKPQRELDEKTGSLNAAVVLQLELDGLLSELRTITGLSDGDEGLEPREQSLVESLRGIYRQIPEDLQVFKKFKENSDLLKSLKTQREEIYDEFETAHEVQDKVLLAKLNLQAIHLNQQILKLQLLIAGMILTGKTKLNNKPMRQSAALSTLEGAINSSVLLQDELRFRIGRLNAGDKIRAIETTDWLGRIVRSYRLGAFDIEISPVEKDEDKEPVVTLRQQRWINIHTRLEDIFIKARKGNREQGLKELDELIKIFQTRYIPVSLDNDQLLNEMKSLKVLIEALTEGVRITDPKILSPFAFKITGLTTAIKFPKQRIWVDVDYKDISAAFRSYVHRLAGYTTEIGTISYYRTVLEVVLSRLELYKKKGRIGPRQKQTVLINLEEAASWVEKGFVYPKQRSEINLRAAIENINNGATSQGIEEVRKTIEMLLKRMEEIVKIVGHTNEHAVAVYSAFREQDSLRRMDLVKSAIQDGDFESASDKIEEIIDLYFDEEHEFIEPGLKRAQRGLNQVIFRLRKNFLVNQRNKDSLIATLETIKNDISHKQSFRITVIPENDQERNVFVAPGTTIEGLLNIGRRNLSKVKVSLGSGWINSTEWRTIKLNDLSRVKIADKAMINLELSKVESSYSQGFLKEKLSTVFNQIPEALKLLQREGVDISSNAMKNDKTLRTSQILNEKLGFSITASQLWAQIVVGKKTPWNKYLGNNGFEVSKITSRMTWDEEMVSNIPQTLLALFKKFGAQRLNAGSFSEDESDEMSAIIKDNLGMKITGKTLYHKIIREKESLRQALKEAGLTSQQIDDIIEKERWSDEEKDNIPNLIRDLVEYAQNNQIDINAKAVETDIEGPITSLVSQFMEREITGKAFYTQVRLRYGGWEDALEQLGIDSVSKKRESWTQVENDRLPFLIKKIFEQVGVDGFSLFFNRSMTENDKKLIEEGLGGIRTKRALRNQLIKIYGEGDYLKALNSIGLPGEKIIARRLDTTVYYQNEKFDSQLERNTYIVLNYIGVIGSLKHGDNWQREIDGKRIDFVTEKGIFEPHYSSNHPYMKGETTKQYTERRKELLKGTNLDGAPVYVFSNISDLFKLLKESVNKEISLVDRRKIRMIIERANKEIEVPFEAGEEVDYFNLKRDEVLEILEGNDWKIGDPEVKRSLGLSNGKSFYDFFASFDLLNDLKKKVKDLLDQNLTIAEIGNKLGTDRNVIGSLIIDLKIQVNLIDKERALKILNENNWRIGDPTVKKSLGMKNKHSYSSFYRSIGLQDILKEKLAEALKNQNGAVFPTAKIFSVNDDTLLTLMRDLNIVLNKLDKNEALKILETRDWRIGDEVTRNSLGIRNGQGYYEFFKSLDLLNELKGKILERLKQNPEGISDNQEEVFQKFAISRPALRSLIKEFGISNTGGIDLTSDQAMQVKNDGNGEIQFHLDSAQLAQLQNASGFVPVIISIEPMMDLKGFLGLAPSSGGAVVT